MPIPANIRFDGSTLSRYALPPIPQFPSMAGHPKSRNDCVMDLHRRERGKQARMAYEWAIERLLTEISLTVVGSIILSAIALTRKTLLIKPYLDWSVVNAITHQNSTADAIATGLLPNQGLPDDPKTPEDESRRVFPVVGTGRGSDVEIAFSPRLEAFSEFPDSTSGTAPLEPSGILLHELVHALRGMTGTMRFVPLNDPSAAYKNTEEFVAVVIANIYASERGASVLRKDYTQGVVIPMDPQYMQTGRFFDSTTAYGRANMDALILSKLDLALMLQLGMFSTARFNPFRDLLDIPRNAVNRVLRALGL